MIDKETLKSKLIEDIDKASWEMLEDHHKRGAVFVVDAGVNLEDVGAALALDDSNTVKIWLDNKQLYKLEDTPSETSSAREIEFLIIQPYVLIKLPN